jgi:hypothetical protein
LLDDVDRTVEVPAVLLELGERETNCIAIDREFLPSRPSQSTSFETLSRTPGASLIDLRIRKPTLF